MIDKIMATPGLYIALFVCILLLLVCLVGGGIYLWRTRKHTKRQVQSETIADEDLRDEEELPNEILILLLSAAAATVLGEEHTSSFRVVAFRRLR